MNDQAPLIVARDLSYATPDGRPLVSGLSFSVRRGEILAVTGPNGVGKSTLLGVLLGELPAMSGTLEKDYGSIGYLSQLHNREFHIPLRLSDVLAFNIRGRLEVKDATRYGLLLPSDLTLSWNTASGGERQKTLLTQALLANPDLLILDEPMNHLDAKTRQVLVEVLHRFVADGKRGVLIVCHEKTLAGAEWTSASTIDLARHLPH